jgi:hypothetical protein
MLRCRREIPGQAWYTSYANLRRYAVPLNHEFSAPPMQKEPGCLDFVPAVEPYTYFYRDESMPEESQKHQR